MHDAAAVGVRQSGRHVLQDAYHPLRGEGTLLLEHFLEVSPRYVLHQEGQASVGQPVGPIQLDDVGVEELGHELGFPLEASQGLFVSAEAGPDDLQGHVPVQRPVPEEIDHRSGAPSELADELEVAFQALDGLFQLLDILHGLTVFPGTRPKPTRGPE